MRLVGQASRRGLIPRQPSTETIVEDIDRWLRAEAADVLRHVRRADVAPTDDGEESAAAGAELRIGLHPAASDVALRVSPGGRIEVDASTVEVGPGYHTYLCHLLARLGTDVSVDWQEPENEGEGDPTGYFTTEQRPDVERFHLGWLHAGLRRAAEVRARRSETVHLQSFGGHRFGAGGAIATALGPRDDAWLLAALESPRVATDVWPWAADAMDARYLLNRALCLLWTEVRWRSPATDEERAVLDEVLRLLRKAFPLDSDLPYPWREWREVLQLAGAGQDPMTARVVEEAQRAPETGAIGYRREPVTVVHAGWELTVPGSFAERRGDEEWWGGESGRGITLAATHTGEGGEPMPAETFLDRVAGHLGRDALVHREGPVVGRAHNTVDGSSGISIAVVEGYSAVLGSGAAIRIEIDDPGDWEWALDMWRSLAPASAGRWSLAGG